MMARNQRAFPRDNAAGNSTPERRTIPFDYAFRYELTGRRNTVLNKTVTVSIEAAFTAVSIGYGVVPKVTPIIFGPTFTGLKEVAGISLREILLGLTDQLKKSKTSLPGEAGPEAVFKNGLRLNPELAEFALQTFGGTRFDQKKFERIFEVIGSPPERIQFKYAIFDEGSGREFQSEPILNIAGLGSAAGERPFRYFAQPIVFRPRSTIRLEVTEVTGLEGDELNISLHGYKELGTPNSPTGLAQRSGGPRR